MFGATFMVLAPEHPLVDELTQPDRKAEVEAYRFEARRKTEIDRLSTEREKTGVALGAHAINPINGEQIPIWIADYVLLGYGTGAIMAVPAHDERDFAFAQQFSLPIRGRGRVAADVPGHDGHGVRRPHRRTRCWSTRASSAACPRPMVRVPSPGGWRRPARVSRP